MKAQYRKQIHILTMMLNARTDQLADITTWIKKLSNIETDDVEYILLQLKELLSLHDSENLSKKNTRVNEMLIEQGYAITKFSHKIAQLNELLYDERRDNVLLRSYMMGGFYYVWAIVNGVMELSEFVTSMNDKDALLDIWRDYYDIEKSELSNGDDSIDLGWERFYPHAAWQPSTTEGEGDVTT